MQSPSEKVDICVRLLLYGWLSVRVGNLGVFDFFHFELIGCLLELADLGKTNPAPQKRHIHEESLGELIFGSLHTFM